MRVFVLGATGSIGGAVTDELLTHGHDVRALARSDASDLTLAAKGVDTVRGDIRDPAPWCSVVDDVDAIVHVAATFDDDMGAIDRRMLQALIAQTEHGAREIRFLYTGGCWLYGATGDIVATEKSKLTPIPAFAWMADNVRLAFAAKNLAVTLVHPAMVYERDGGVLSRFIASAHEDGAVEIWGSADTRWPVVHREDLASAYRLALEAGLPSNSYNVAAEQGVRVGDISAAVHNRLGLTKPPVVRPVADAVAEHGAWAAGPALDQQMSAQRFMKDSGWRPRRVNILEEIS